MDETLKCKSCGNRVPIADLRADKSGSGWICMNCYKNQHPEIYKPQKISKMKTGSLQAVQQPRLHRVKYYCTECGYKFDKEVSNVDLVKSQSQRYQGKCPYCNLYSVRQEKDAETILRDVISESSLRFNRRGDIIDD